MTNRPLLCLAPLQGVTTAQFRTAFAACFGGFDYAVAPFILSAKGARLSGSHFKDLLPEANRGIRVVPQILSNDPGAFLETVSRLRELGYREVDWNLGCPYPMVANKGRGSGLLPHPDRVRAFLDEVCADPELRLSVKLRLGRERSDEILALAPILNDHPLRRVTIHPRLGIQMYEGEVDLEGFAAAIAEIRHPIVYNGDILDSAGFAALQARFAGLSGWMIGRGAIRDPFLAGDIVGDIVPIEDRPARLRAFHAELYGEYRDALSGPRHVLDKMKEVWSYLGPSFAGANKALKALTKASSFEAYEAAVAKLFSEGTWLAGTKPKIAELY